MPLPKANEYIKMDSDNSILSQTISEVVENHD